MFRTALKDSNEPYACRDVFNERPVGEAATAALEAGGAGGVGPAASEQGWAVLGREVAPAVR